MYVAMLLTDWYVLSRFTHPLISPFFIFVRNVVSKHPIDSPADPNQDVYIGRSEVAMWMRVVSSWACMLLYMWSLWAPVLMPDRYVRFSRLTVNRLSFY